MHDGIVGGSVGAVVGAAVGFAVGAVGAAVVRDVGDVVGVAVGAAVGTAVGDSVGAGVAVTDGADVGSCAVVDALSSVSSAMGTMIFIIVEDEGEDVDRPTRSATVLK